MCALPFFQLFFLLSLITLYMRVVISLLLSFLFCAGKEDSTIFFLGESNTLVTKNARKKNNNGRTKKESKS